MASGIPSKHEAFPPNRDGRSNSPVRKSLKPHQNSKKVNENVRNPRRSERIGHPDKSRVQSSQGQPTLKHVNDRVVLLKSAAAQQRQCASGEIVKDDELVRHMTNLPDYLQRVETRGNLQGKALNFGVLDWSRLENFTRNCNTGTRNHQSEQRGSLGPNPSYCEMDGISRCVKPSASKVVCSQDVESASKSILEGHGKIHRAYRSLRKKCSDVALQKDNRNSLNQRTVSELGGSSDLWSSTFSVSPRKNRTVSRGEGNTRVGKVAESGTRVNNREQKCMSVAGTSSLKPSTDARSISLKETITAENDETKKKIEKSLNRETSNTKSSQNKANAALLSTSKHPHTSSLDASQKSDTGKLFERSLTDATWNYFSDVLFVEELCSRELCLELPHSCPMSLKVVAQKGIARRGSELEFDEPSTFSSCSRSRDGLSSSEISNTRKQNDSDNTRNSSKGEAMGSLNQAAVDSAGKKSRHPSANHRFSFSSGRISRSFSFRESASAPLCSSASVSDRSGPIASEDFPCSGNLTKEKPDIAIKWRSGIRRLLDPLLRSKSALSYCRSESIRQSEHCLTSLSLSNEYSTESLQIGNHDASTVQALLQVSSVDGLPLFKFVVGKNSHIVAAANRDATLSGRSNCGRNYKIYSVDEMTKKSNSWIGQGSKMRSGGFVSNVVGQLTFRDACSDNCNEQTVEGEYVLSGLGLCGAEKESRDPPMNRELAAIIFKIPVDRPSNCNAQATNHKIPRVDLQGENCFSKLPNEDNNLMVILPGGDHSIPSNREPSSLIDRWRTGGSCDCGGWDVGCKLHILSPQKDFREALRTSSVCSTSDNLELFVQGEAQQENAIFSLKLYTTGIYLVEFNPTISSLQAFAICLAVISCQTSSEPSDWRQLSKSRTLRGHSVGRNDVNLPNMAPHFEVPPRYPPYPPFSPLDRA